jgi:acetoin utilization protein AcuC
VADPVALVTADEGARAYDFGSTHPLRPERVLLTCAAIQELGLSDLPHVSELGAPRCSDEQIALVHDPGYIDVVKGIDAGTVDHMRATRYGIGTPDDPVFPGMHAASAAVCGASVAAAEVVVRGEALHSFNPAGGLHHARRREASGFCIYNDPAVAIACILRMRPDWRVMYVDVDVHHGDGVQWIFYEEPRVLTLSLHQSGRFLYPGTGFEEEIGEGKAAGTCANIPLLPLTGEDDYLWALSEVLPSLARAFRPHVLVTQLGADTHYGDPLANLGLTLAAYPQIARLLHDTAHEVCEGRWVATGGGGYQWKDIVPKAWTAYFAEMCGAPDNVPSSLMDDREPRTVSKSYRSEVERSVRTVLSSCLPLLRDLVRGEG